MTTTDPPPLQERIARALYENADYYGPAPTQPPWDWRDDEERGEWMEIAAAVLPIIRAAQADAWDEGQASGWDEAQEQWQINGMVGDVWKRADTCNPYREQED